MKPKNHITLCIGCNADHERQMARARSLLTAAFPDMLFTDVLTSAAYGQEADAAPYCNMMGCGTTVMDYATLLDTLKKMETAAGNSAALRAQGVVMMDMDLMQYNGRRCHEKDWERPYVKTLHAMLRKVLTVLTLLTMTCGMTAVAQRKSVAGDNDKELLGKAVEYYIGGKYHETILAFEKLKRRYALTPRLTAYLGFSYYKEGEYKDAVEPLRKSIPELSAFSPKEQSAYVYACAESLFNLQRYDEAIGYYDMLVPMTEGNDRGDVLFHKAFSLYINKGMEAMANDSVRIRRNAREVGECYEMLSEARKLYVENVQDATSLQTARLRQCERMIKGFDVNMMRYIQINDTLSH